MYDSWPSTTAMMVSLMRGIGAPARVVDPLAARLLPEPVGALVGLGRLLAQRPAGVWVMRLASLGLLEHITLRTRAIDAALTTEARKRPIEQLVILGAGLDARAWRLTALRDATVFEVDHPATQRFKLDRLGAAQPVAREVVHVAVDFETQSLDERLAACGHDASRPTVWLWEGVTPYLTRDATEASLSALAARSAPGSALVVSYATPSMVSLPALLHPIGLAAFMLIGEPLRGAISTEALSAMLSARGLSTEHDSGAADWAQRFDPARQRPWVIIHERLMFGRVPTTEPS